MELDIVRHKSNDQKELIAFTHPIYWAL